MQRALYGHFRSYGILFIRSSGFYLFGCPVLVLGPCLATHGRVASLRHRPKTLLPLSLAFGIGSLADWRMQAERVNPKFELVKKCKADFQVLVRDMPNLE